MSQEDCFPGGRLRISSGIKTAGDGRMEWWREKGEHFFCLFFCCITGFTRDGISRFVFMVELNYRDLKALIKLIINKL